jgi:integrase/recombinase XerD
MELYNQFACEVYLRSVINLTKYYQRSPDRITAKEIQAYQYHLVQSGKMSAKTINVYMAGIRFSCLVTLNRNWNSRFFPTIKEKRKVPVILSPDEVTRLIASAKNIKHRTILMVLYASGLRISEAIHLKSEDIHSHRMLIHVRFAKNSKERFAVLPQSLLDQLRLYWKQSNEDKTHWLFPGTDPKKPFTSDAMRRVFEKIKSKTEVHKEATLHTLRHCFATHFLEIRSGFENSSSFVRACKNRKHSRLHPYQPCPVK